MLRRVSLLALGASVVVHGILLKVADEGFSVPTRDPLQEMTLVDVIIPPAEPVPITTAAPEPPPVAPAPEPKPRPRPRPRPEPKPRAVVSPVPEPVAPVAPSEPERDSVEAAAEPLPDRDRLAAIDGGQDRQAIEPKANVEAGRETEAGAAVAPPEPALDPRALDLSSWPASGSILFRVMYGERGFQVGEAEHRWSHDDARYEMETELQTTGVTALFRRFHYVQRSVGGLGEAGLRPERFSVEQAGKKPEWASFDWGAGQVIIQRRKGKRTAPIEAGDQDVLSLWHQIGIVGAEGLPLELTVVSNKAASPSRLSVVGIEAAALPIGRLDTLHLHAQANDGGLAIDIWLARRYGMLPVRIRIVDDKGEVFDQQAVHLRLAPPPGNNRSQGADPQVVELREQVDPFTLYK